MSLIAKSHGERQTINEELERIKQRSFFIVSSIVMMMRESSTTAEWKWTTTAGGNMREKEKSDNLQPRFQTWIILKDWERERERFACKRWCQRKRSSLPTSVLRNLIDNWYDTPLSFRIVAHHATSQIPIWICTLFSFWKFAKGLATLHHSNSIRCVKCVLLPRYYIQPKKYFVRNVERKLLPV